MADHVRAEVAADWMVDFKAELTAEIIVRSAGTTRSHRALVEVTAVELEDPRASTVRHVGSDLTAPHWGAEGVVAGRRRLTSWSDQIMRLSRRRCVGSRLARIAEGRTAARGPTIPAEWRVVDGARR